jgi:hypothetical protein
MPLPDDPDPAPVPDQEEAWETPGSSLETAIVVGAGGSVGAMALVGGAPAILGLLGHHLDGTALHALLVASGGLGAAVGSYFAWRILGKT